MAITPRSFCNGPYFRPFRELLLRETTLGKIHVFHSRENAFSDDDVLQENIIFQATKGTDCPTISISSSHGREFEDLSVREVPSDRVVSPGDQNLVIHIPIDEVDEYIKVLFELEISLSPCA